MHVYLRACHQRVHEIVKYGLYEHCVSKTELHEFHAYACVHVCVTPPEENIIRVIADCVTYGNVTICQLLSMQQNCEYFCCCLCFYFTLLYFERNLIMSTTFFEEKL